MTHYVLGFLIHKGYAVLIRKNRPAWQAGKLNGVGGHVEENESAVEAIQREFFEETGVLVDYWKHFCVMTGIEDGGWTVDCFWAQASFPLSHCKSMTDEPIEVHEIRSLTHQDGIENLPWLFAMIDSQQVDGVDHYVVNYIRRRTT